MEWSDADQELFEQTADLYDAAKAVDAVYEEVHAARFAAVLEPLLTAPEAVHEGIWLSDLVEKADDDEEVNPEQAAARQAAVKHMAAELGLGAEDVIVQEDDGNRTDTIIRSYALADLPSEPQKAGDVYICEGRVLSEREALRVMAARSWAEQAAGNRSAQVKLQNVITASIHAMGRPDYAVAVTYEDPNDEVVRVTAKPSAVVPQGDYERLHTESDDTIVVRVETPDPPPLPIIGRASRLMGYSVDLYEYIDSTDGHTYDAILEQQDSERS